MWIAQHLWGAPMDFGGRNVLDVKDALKSTTAAINLTENLIRGTEWQWLVRKLDADESPPFRYFANLSRVISGVRVVNQSHALLPNVALIISLIKMVEFERTRTNNDGS